MAALPAPTELHSRLTYMLQYTTLQHMANVNDTGKRREVYEARVQSYSVYIPYFHLLMGVRATTADSGGLAG